MVIPPPLCKRLPRQEEKSPAESPWQSFNLPPFYPTPREYWSLLAAAQITRFLANAVKSTSGKQGGPWKRIKEHDRSIRLARVQTSAISEHAHKTGHCPLWKEAEMVKRNPSISSPDEDKQ